MTKKIIEVKNITKSFSLAKNHNTILQFLTFKGDPLSNHAVLKNISFSINKGDCVFIIGKNGGGKTTLLRVIAGILKQDKGKIFLKEPVTPVLQLGSGFHPELNAIDNIYMYGNIYNLTRKEMTPKINNILNFSGLEEFKDLKLKNYSSGMYSRLAFSVMININPKILLLDEIFSVGDHQFRNKCFKFLHQFKKKGGTILATTHHFSKIPEIADKVIYLKNGKIKFYGSPEKAMSMYLKDQKA